MFVKLSGFFFFFFFVNQITGFKDTEAFQHFIIKIYMVSIFAVYKHFRILFAFQFCILHIRSDAESDQGTCRKNSGILDKGGI